MGAVAVVVYESRSILISRLRISTSSRGRGGQVADPTLYSRHFRRATAREGEKAALSLWLLANRRARPAFSPKRGKQNFLERVARGGGGGGSRGDTSSS